MRTEIKEEVLTDGSKAYNVELKQNYETILFYCNSLKDAYKLAEILRTGIVDFEYKDRR